MRILAKKSLIGLPVETRSGTGLGKISDVEIDAESHLIANYHVQNSALLPGVFAKKFIISRLQVVAITDKKVIVDDLAAREAATEESTDKEWGELPATSAGGNLSARE